MWLDLFHLWTTIGIFNHSLTKKLNFATLEGFEAPIFRFESRDPFRWALSSSPFLFCCSECLLKCTLALDATCRLTLSIFYFVSDDGFVNSFFPFRSSFGIFNLFLTMNWKVKITEGFEHPTILVRSERPLPLGYAAWWRLRQFVFIAVSGLGEK